MQQRHDDETENIDNGRFQKLSWKFPLSLLVSADHYVAAHMMIVIQDRTEYSVSCHFKDNSHFCLLKFQNSLKNANNGRMDNKTSQLEAGLRIE